MRLPLRLVFVLYVVIEVALFVLGVRWLGGATMFLWVLATAVLGGVLVRREGIRAMETVRAAVRERQAPAPTVPDRGLVATGGVLLMFPGVLTDLVGFVLVIPATRPLARRVLRMFATVAVGRIDQVPLVQPPPSASNPAPGPIIRGEVLDSRDEPAG